MYKFIPLDVNVQPQQDGAFDLVFEIFMWDKCVKLWGETFCSLSADTKRVDNQKFEINAEEIDSTVDEKL